MSVHMTGGVSGGGGGASGGVDGGDVYPGGKGGTNGGVVGGVDGGADGGIPGGGPGGVLGGMRGGVVGGGGGGGIGSHTRPSLLWYPGSHSTTSRLREVFAMAWSSSVTSSKRVTVPRGASLVTTKFASAAPLVRAPATYAPPSALVLLPL